MEPITFPEQNVVIAENQPPFLPFPAFVDLRTSTVVGCWRLTLLERIRVLWTGRIWQSVLTGGTALQPQLLDATKPPYVVKGPPIEELQKQLTAELNEKSRAVGIIKPNGKLQVVERIPRK